MVKNAGELPEPIRSLADLECLLIESPARLRSLPLTQERVELPQRFERFVREDHDLLKEPWRHWPLRYNGLLRKMPFLPSKGPT